MLRYLRVTNFAILSDVALDFVSGFNVLTGETGAGKSLIVEAVNLLRGGRASADIPRTGASEAVVEAIFEVPDDLAVRVRGVLEASGLPTHSGLEDDEPEDDGPCEVLIRRVIQRGGRSRTYVNGALTTAKRLAELGANLVDLSGQHQHQGLVDPRRHREILDTFAGDPGVRDAMAAAWERLRAIEADIEALGGDERTRAERLDYLRFQHDELDGAHLVAGEDEALEGERVRLQAVDKLEGGTRLAEALLYSGDDSAIDRMTAAARELERIVDVDAALDVPYRQIEEARALAEDAAMTLRQYADRLDADPERLAEIDDRIALLSRLSRKHGTDLAGLRERLIELRAEIENLDNREVRLAELERERTEADRHAREAARALTRTRKKAAQRLMRTVGAALAELGMRAAALSVDIRAQELSVDGADHVEFMLASNAGEAAKPLAKIASGGELSRIMLALKLALRRADEVATYVFDEVDTGIGGATADVVGQQIRTVADHRQVLCVTHLPQIAAFADRHFHVSKSEAEGRTETVARRLEGADRRDEMARMLGGSRVTKSARAHADELLAACGRKPPPRRERRAS